MRQSVVREQSGSRFGAAAASVRILESAMPSRRPDIPLPPEYSPDALTRYVYRHFSLLLTEEELAVDRVRIGRAKQLLSRYPVEAQSFDSFGLREVQAKYPELMRRIHERGPASLMRDAAERVLRDHPEKKILHCCSKCGELCLTPRARFCMACGFSWHSPEGE
jgi:hypothetical protein